MTRPSPFLTHAGGEVARGAGGGSLSSAGGARTCAVLLLLACGHAESPSKPLPTSGVTTNGLYALSWETEPTPIPLSQLFEVRVSVTDAKTGAPADGATVRVDARMPQHGHGMSTKPEHLPAVDGVHVTRGMKFHMPGDWTLSFDVEGPAGADRLEAVLRI